MHRNPNGVQIGSDSPSKYFREQAHLARRFAERAENREGQIAWRNIAQQWSRLALEAKTRPTVSPSESALRARPIIINAS